MFENMDKDVVDLSSDESISNIPLSNFYSPPATSKNSKNSKGNLDPEPTASSDAYSGRRLRSSSKPFSRELLKKTYSKKLKKLKKNKNPAEEKPKTPIEKVKEPEAVVDEVVTTTVKSKVPPSKAITILEDVIISGSIKLNKTSHKLSIDIDPELQEKWYLSGLGAEAGRAGLHVRPDPALRGSALLLWAAAGASTLASVHGTVQLTPPEVRCSHGLYVCEMVEAARMVHERSLVTHVKTLECIACCKLTLVMFGYKDYLKIPCKKIRVASEFDIETAIADLIVSINCDTIIINEPNELVMTVVQYHKGFTSFYKKDTCIEEDEADFYMKGFNKKCVAVDKDGVGLASLWQQMMAILPKSSLETARALCARLPSPRALYETFTTPMGLEAVSGLLVSRSCVPGTRARRIGPDLARKLKILFTVEDGSTVVM